MSEETRNQKIERVLEERGWKELYNKRFKVGNLIIYYRIDFKEWRIRAEGMTMDITTIDYPLPEESWAKLHRTASQHYREH